MTNFLPLLTVTLALAAFIQIAKSARPLVLFLVLGRKEMAEQAYGRSALAAGLTAASALSVGWWLGCAAFAVLAAVLGVLWWNSRRKGRRKALRLLGGKARAVLAAMARNMPRPSPRLVPQGARA